MPQKHDKWFSTPPTHMGDLRRFRCDECGYGASRRTEPVRCPMCGGAKWNEDAWRPSDALVHDLDPATQPMRREAAAIGVLPGVPLS